MGPSFTSRANPNPAPGFVSCHFFSFSRFSTSNANVVICVPNDKDLSRLIKALYHHFHCRDEEEGKIKDPVEDVPKRKKTKLKRTHNTQRGLQGRASGRKSRRDVVGKESEDLSTMPSAHDLSSEATQSNDGAIAQGMLNFAIACSNAMLKLTDEAANIGILT